VNVIQPANPGNPPILEALGLHLRLADTLARLADLEDLRPDAITGIRSAIEDALQLVEQSQ
jgi:hypothetical protein